MGDDPDLGHRVVCRSAEEAEREASRWLAHLADTSRHDWKRVEPLQIKARPTHNLPCRVLGIAGENSDGGYSPLFMLMASSGVFRQGVLVELPAPLLPI